MVDASRGGDEEWGQSFCFGELQVQAAEPNAAVVQEGCGCKESHLFVGAKKKLTIGTPCRTGEGGVDCFSVPIYRFSF